MGGEGWLGIYFIPFLPFGTSAREPAPNTSFCFFLHNVDSLFIQWLAGSYKVTIPYVSGTGKVAQKGALIDVPVVMQTMPSAIKNAIIGSTVGM